MKDRNQQNFTSDRDRLNYASKNAEGISAVSEELFELEMPAERDELLSKCIELGLPVEESDDDVILRLIYEAAKDKFTYYKKADKRFSPSNT